MSVPFERVISLRKRVILAAQAKEPPIPGVLAGINEVLHIHDVNDPPAERRRSIASNQEGQTMAEYGIILGTVGLLATAAFLIFGQAIVSMFGPIVTAVTS